MNFLMLITRYSLLVSGLVALIFAVSLLPTGEREPGPIENIYGIPYPKVVEGQPQSRLITEPLAHADIYLKEPVLAKQLELTITYRPISVTSLAVGIREDAFWLSYANQQALPTTPYNLQTTTLIIPLTDKLQETDRSLDLMFFAEGDAPLWELHDLKTRVTYTRPAYRQFRNYVGSVLKRERAL